MFDTLDVFVHHFEDTNVWHVHPQTLNNLNDSNEQHAELDVHEFEDKAEALDFATDLAKSWVNDRKSRNSTVFLEGNEYFHI